MRTLCLIVWVILSSAVLLQPGGAGEAAAPGGVAVPKAADRGAQLTAEEKAYLLGLARESIRRRLDGEERMVIPAEKLSPALAEKKGCFVTLKENGVLRGCIGTIMPQESLCDCVIHNAVNAAVKDSRFSPLSDSRKLKDLAIEISVLSVPQGGLFSTPEELLNALVPLRDGVILRHRWGQATYLPQVWEHFMNKEEFLNSLCQKGGMRSDCWKDPETEVFIYHAEVIRDSGVGK